MWYVRQWRRFQREREAVCALDAEVDWLGIEGWRIDSCARLCLDAELTVLSRKFPVTLTYGLNFPDSPPSVTPRVPERWSGHQYGRGGELCLEYGPDNWREDITGADMLRSVERLLRLEGQGTGGSSDIVPSRHSTTRGQDLRNNLVRLLVTRSLNEVLPAIPRGATCRVTFWSLFRDESYVIIPVELMLRGVNTWLDPSVPPAIKPYAYTSNGLAFSLPEGAGLPSISTGSELKASLVNLGFAAPNDFVPDRIELILVHGGIPPELFWIGSDDKAYRASAILPSGGQRLDADHATLCTKSIGIVGCGSVGSKVAAMLARSGVRRFVLVDDDVFTPENLVRNELDWASIGEHKVDALARRIGLIAADSICKVRRQRIGGQEANAVADGSLTLLKECDLILDATADPRVFNVLSGVSKRAQRSYVWVQVFAGGFGGAVARSRPSEDPDPQTMRARIDAWCADKGVEAPRVTGGYESLQNDIPLIADDADVSVMAAHAARICIDCLLGRTPSWFPVSAYMVGLAPGWLFREPFHTYPIDVGAPLDPPEADTPPDEAHLKAIVELITNRRDESPSSS